MSVNPWRVFYRPGDRHDESPLSPGERRHWTCHQETLAGDCALLYVKKPVSALVGVLVALKPAKREHSEYSSHEYQCDVRVECLFKQPLTFKEMREDEELSEEWSLVRGQFQAPGGVPPVVPGKVMQQLAERIPELKPLV